MKTGEWKDDTAWVDVEIWREPAERLKDKLQKGSPVHIEGRLKSDEFEDKKTGEKRRALKVVARRVQVLAKSEAGAPGASGEKSSADLEEVPF
jgi:single-strand DNA-binding protein